jgi:hypothetical protein
MPPGSQNSQPNAVPNDPGTTLASSLHKAVVDDFRGAAWGQRFALIGVVVWLAYEWGPGNETVTPWLLARIIHENAGVVVIPITVGVGFTFTAVQQLASGLTALAGFSIFERTSRAAQEKLRSDTGDVPGAWNRLSFVARCALVFGLGTTAVALLEIMSTGEIGVRRHARVIARSALLCGTLVASIGAVVATIAFFGRRTEALASQTEWLLRLLGNPLFWLGVLVAGLALRSLKGRFGKGRIGELPDRTA